MPTAGPFPATTRTKQGVWGEERPPHGYMQETRGIHLNPGKRPQAPQKIPVPSDPLPANRSPVPPDSKALERALLHGSDCSTGRASCETCGEKLDVDIQSIREMLAQTQEEDDEVLNDHFASHQTDLETLSKPSSDGNEKDLLSRVHASFLLEAFAILQLKYAIRLVRTRSLRRRALDKVLKQALMTDGGLAEHVKEIDVAARIELFDNINELDRIFDANFPLLRREGLGSHNIVEQLELEHIVYIREVLLDAAC
ncbi:hypothetical protein BKA70DRAFT_1433757 [Coprinopsis sp. MPI-PUGE-AT-0042]|nr:hypothetical protein BKA70DRAFT_1433757 [Coprinopsis sp. MPI-PUGE-AT-0042]